MRKAPARIGLWRPVQLVSQCCYSCSPHALMPRVARHVKVFLSDRPRYAAACSVLACMSRSARWPSLRSACLGKSSLPALMLGLFNDAAVPAPICEITIHARRPPFSTTFEAAARPANQIDGWYTQGRPDCAQLHCSSAACSSSPGAAVPCLEAVNSACGRVQMQRS